ncbi:hypothetical protein K1X76_05665 [bacterium]|nr:hypothetical protein [bacterium]
MIGNPLLLIAATKPEWSFLKKHYAVRQQTKFPPLYQLSEQLYLLQIGIGKEAALKNLDLLKQSINLQDHKILHIGYSGALIPSLKTGDLIIPEENSLTLNNITATSGSFTSSSVILKNKAEKEILHQQTKAIAVDMEYETVKTWAQDNKMPYTALRVIFDELEEDISFLAENPMMHENGDISAGKAALAFAKKPNNIMSIPKLQKMAHRASHSLEKALMQLFFS